jgi:hypothetical protein
VPFQIQMELAINAIKDIIQFRVEDALKQIQIAKSFIFQMDHAINAKLDTQELELQMENV